MLAQSEIWACELESGIRKKKKSAANYDNERSEKRKDQPRK